MMLACFLVSWPTTTRQMTFDTTPSREEPNNQKLANIFWVSKSINKGKLARELFEWTRKRKRSTLHM